MLRMDQVSSTYAQIAILTLYKPLEERRLRGNKWLLFDCVASLPKRSRLFEFQRRFLSSPGWKVQMETFARSKRDWATRCIAYTARFCQRWDNWRCVRSRRRNHHCPIPELSVSNDSLPCGSGCKYRFGSCNF